MRTPRLPRLTMAAAIAGILALAPVSAARADLLLYESFDYTPGAVNGLAANGLNLTGNYTTSSLQDLAIAAPGLTYGNLIGAPAVAGNRLTDPNGVVVGSVSVNAAQAISVAAGEAIYFSALFTLDDSTNGNRYASVALVDGTTGDEIGFGEAAVGVRAVRATANTAATGGLIADGADFAFENGQTLWLVGRYINSAAPGGDVLELLGYDTADAIALPPVFDFADPNAQFAFGITGQDIDLTQITSLRFEVRGDDNNFLDEVRVGRTYAAVAAIPEPSSGLLLACGVFLAGAVLRRRRRGRAQRVSCSRAKRASNSSGSRG
jgi:PEP-CTERM putative exosortase interaction domain